MASTMPGIAISIDQQDCEKKKSMQKDKKQKKFKGRNIVLQVECTCVRVSILVLTRPLEPAGQHFLDEAAYFSLPRLRCFILVKRDFEERINF
jgi:hypothetical protein